MTKPNCGTIKTEYISIEEAKITWEIDHFFSIDKNKKYSIYQSPIFYFSSASWYLQLYPNGIDITISEFMYLYLCNDKLRQFSVEFTFGLKKLDGNVEELLEGILLGKYTRTIATPFLKKSEIYRRRTEFVTSNILSIVCRLKRGSISSVQQKQSTLDETKQKPQLKKLIKPETLSEKFKNLLTITDSCDVTLNVKDKEFKAHRAVLIAWSSVFAAMFLHDTSEKRTGIVTIPDCDPESFGEFLEFLYCGKLEEPPGRNALHLYETSDKYNILELKTFCTKYLMENVTVENVCDIAMLSDKYEEKELLSAAQSFFNKNMSEIFVTPKWVCLFKDNHRLANKLLIEMSSKVTVTD